MDKLQAEKLQKGDSVQYRGESYVIHRIRSRGSLAPYFKINYVGFVSYRMVTLSTETGRASSDGPALSP